MWSHVSHGKTEKCMVKNDNNQLTASHLRGLQVCLWNDGSEMGKGFNLQTTQTKRVYTILEILFVYVT